MRRGCRFLSVDAVLVRAGPLQSSRQRRQICARWHDDPHRGPPPRRHAFSLRILDEGPGIALEETERIFDKFHRAEKQDKVRAGTGLGLGISRGFIEAMGGTLTASNRKDRSGAILEIIMPVPSQLPVEALS